MPEKWTSSRLYHSCDQRRSHSSQLLFTISTFTCKQHAHSVHNTQPRLLLSPAGLSVESSGKKSKPGLAPGPNSTYNPADSSDLPSWITERVRICQRLAPASAPSPPHPNPPPHPPAPAQQHQQQPQSSSPGSAVATQSNSNKEFVLYWMRTALRGHENPALVCFLLKVTEVYQ